MSYRIAVASSDGKIIDTGFGKAPFFYIYEAGDEGYSLLEIRERSVDSAEGECCGEKNCRLQESRDHGDHGDKLTVVSDCICVVCKEIGPGIKRALERRGVLCFDIETGVEDALEKIVRYINRTLPASAVLR